jgi:hypothetical protein
MNIKYVDALFWLPMPASVIHKMDDNYYINTQYFLYLLLLFVIRV